MAGHSSWRLLGAALAVLGTTAAAASARGIAGDPYVASGAPLTESSMSAGALFGLSGAISGDGGTVIVGAPSDGSSGSAYVFVPAGSGWSQQAILSDGALPAQAYFGDAVAISDNGGTALVGAPNAGAVLVFERAGTSWSQTATISAPASITGFGASVALSADGATALIGDNGASGASNLTTAVVYHFSGGSWHEAQVLTPAGESSNGSTFNAAAVALSADASTAIVGNAANGGGEGAAWVFVQSGGGWVAQGGALAGSGATGTGGFGGAVALSADGDIAAIGAPFDDCNDGAAYVFGRSGSNWTQQSAKLTSIGLLGACGVGGPTFGLGAALSANGQTAFFGGGDPVLYTASGSTWTQFQAGFDGGGATSLSDDGSTALATCAGCEDGAGEAYVYSLTAAAPLPAPEPLELHVSPGAPIGGLRAHASAAHLSVAFRASVASLARVEVLRQEGGVEVDGNCVAAAAGGGSPCKRLVPV
ncbi:MAG TPA: hypothetical protein VL977_08220, partial [Solirubrobacteraceae bacterium]|nr:hypothetical protein [Solirubrobacteraceae bacterium]